MSRNEELVRSIVSAWERGDFSSADWAHPEIEYVIADGPSPGSWTGLAGMAAATRGWLDAWDDVSPQFDRCRELDDDRVLAIGQWSGRSKVSGLDLGALGEPAVFLFHVRAGRITRLVQYLNHANALTDLGLTAHDEEGR